MITVTPLLSSGYAAWAPGQTSATWGPAAGQWNVGYTFSGRVREFLPQGRQSEETPGDFMVLKPGGYHSWEVPHDATEPWRVVWFMFMPKPDWLPLLNLPEEQPHFSRIALAGRKHAGKIGRCLLQAHRLASRSGGEALAMNALERAFLWLQAELAQANTRLDSRVQAVMELFTRRVGTPPDMAEAARVSGLSLSRLGERFRECTGQTPRAWLEGARLSHGRNLLLTTGLPVKLVATACGYSDQRHFATRFRRLFGVSPSACRQSPH